MKNLGTCQAEEIRAGISKRIYLWETGIHAGFVGDTEAKGVVIKGSGVRQESNKELQARRFHVTVLYENM